MTRFQEVESMSSKEDLIKAIIELGSKTGEFSGSKGKDTDLVIEREIVNADYYKVLGEEKIRRTYHAYVLLDENTQEAKYNEEITEASNNLNVESGGMSFGTSKSFFKGKTFGSREFGKTYAIRKDTLTPGKVVDYSFDVNKIQGPIRDLLAQNNWKLVLVTPRKDASYKKKGLFG
jgi:hypothetical protein